MDKEKLRRVALGIDKAAIVLKNCKIVNVFSGLIETGDIAIEEGIIAGIGKYEGITETDMCFSYVSPGLIDGHVHIESSMLSPGQFAKVIVPLGTTTVMITHAPPIAEMADMVIHIGDGRIIETKTNQRPLSAKELVW